MLEIKNLSASVDEKVILNGLNLRLDKGKKVAVMGPNGSGKSTLSNLISGKYGYKIIEGEILFNGENIIDMAPEERAAKGIYMAFQYPVEIPGIANSSFLRTSINAIRKQRGIEAIDTRKFLERCKAIADKLDLDHTFLSRDINCGFSGGEKKKNEILHLLMLEPQLCVIDEVDSGLDIDSLKIIAKSLDHFSSDENSLLIITHYQRLLEFVKPDQVHIFGNGKILESGDYELVKVLEKKGYKEFV